MSHEQAEVAPRRQYRSERNRFAQNLHAAVDVAAIDQPAAIFRQGEQVVRIERDRALRGGNPGVLLAAQEQHVEQQVIGARTLRLQLDTAACCFQRAVERRRIVRPRAHPGHVFAGVEGCEKRETVGRIELFLYFLYRYFLNFLLRLTQNVFKVAHCFPYSIKLIR